MISMHLQVYFCLLISLQFSKRHVPLGIGAGPGPNGSTAQLSLGFDCPRCSTLRPFWELRLFGPTFSLQRFTDPPDRARARALLRVRDVWFCSEPRPDPARLRIDLFIDL